nr:hypothetical protein B0A51_13845 [Rachicladosporium sp. CCFEE 5018]
MSRAQPPDDAPDYRNAKLRFGPQSIPNYGALMWDSLQDITLRDEKSWNAFDALKQRYYQVENNIDRSYGKGVIGGGDGTLGQWTAEELETDQEYLEAKRAYVKGLVSGLQRHDDPSGVLGGVLIESGVFDEVLAVHSDDLGVEREVQELHLSDAGWVAVTRIVRRGKATLLVCDGRECKICAHAEELEAIDEALATSEQDHEAQLNASMGVANQQRPADRVDSATPSETDYGHIGIPVVPTGPRRLFDPNQKRPKRTARGRHFALRDRIPNGQLRPVSTSLADLLGAALPPTGLVVDCGDAQADAANKPTETIAQSPSRLDTAVAPPPPTVLQRRPQSAVSIPNGGVHRRPQPNGLAAAMPYRTHLPRTMLPPYRPIGMPPNMHAQRPGALKIAQTPYIPPATNSTPTLSRPSSAIPILPPSTRTIDASAFRLTARKAALSATATPFQTISPAKGGCVAPVSGVAATKKAVRSDEEALKLFISRKEAWERSLGGGVAKTPAAVEDERVETQGGGVEKSEACAEMMVPVNGHADAKNVGAAEESVSDGHTVATLEVTPPPTCTPITAAPKAAPRVALHLPILRITNPDAPAKPAVNAVTASGVIQGAASGKSGTGGASAESVATSSNTSLPYSAPSSPPPVPQRARKKKPQGPSVKVRLVKQSTTAAAAIATSEPNVTEKEEQHRVTGGNSGSSSDFTKIPTENPATAAQRVLNQAAILRQRFSDCAWLPDAERAVAMKKLDAELEDLGRYAPSVLERLEKSSQSQLPEGSDEVEEPVLAAEDDRHSQGTESGHRDEERDAELRIPNDRHGVSRSASLTIRPYMGVTRIPRPIKQTATTITVTSEEELPRRKSTPTDDSAVPCAPTTTEPHSPSAITHVTPSASGTSIAVSNKPQATPKSYIESLPVNGGEIAEAKSLWNSKQPSISFDAPPSRSSTVVPGSLHRRLLCGAQGHETTQTERKKEPTPPLPALPLKQRATEYSFWDNLPRAEVFREGRKRLTWRAQAALRKSLMSRVLKLDSANDAGRLDSHPRTPGLGRELKPATVRNADKRKTYGLNAEARIVRALKRADLTAEDGESIRRSIDSITAPIEDANPVINLSLEQRKKFSWVLPNPAAALGGTPALRLPTVPKLRAPPKSPFGSSTAHRFAMPSPDEYIAGQREYIDLHAQSPRRKSAALARSYHPFFPSPCPVKRVQTDERKVKTAIPKQASVPDGAPVTATANNVPLVLNGPFSNLRESTSNTTSLGEPSSTDVAKIMANWQHEAAKSSATTRAEVPGKVENGRCEAASELDISTTSSSPAPDATSSRPPDAELVTQRSSHRLRAVRERSEMQTTGEAEPHGSPTASSTVQSQRKIGQRRDSLAMARERLAPLHHPVLDSKKSDDDAPVSSRHVAAPTVIGEAIEPISRTEQAHDLMPLSGGPLSGVTIAPASLDLIPAPDATSELRGHSTPDETRPAVAQTSPPCQVVTDPLASRMHSFWHAALSASSALTSDFWGTSFVGDFEDGSAIALPGEHARAEDTSVIVLRRLRAIVMMIVLIVIAVTVKIAVQQEPDANEEARSMIIW